jgi:hypothetical protein
MREQLSPLFASVMLRRACKIARCGTHFEMKMQQLGFFAARMRAGVG